MCPICMSAAAAALIGSGAVSVGGLGALVSRVLHAQTDTDADPTSRIEENLDDQSTCRVPG